MDWQTRCIRCGHLEPLADFPYHCPSCDGILLIEPDVGEGRWPQIDQAAQGLARYRRLLPLAPDSQLISLGEGNTPLLRAEHLARELDVGEVLLKNETLNPTGSFKDRALALMMTRACGEGFRRVISSSSGNAGASSSAYAARARVGATVLVPETTTVAKLAQIIVHGARVIRVRGSTSDTYVLAKAAAATGEWANLTTTFLSPFATLGFKTIGYELVEQLVGEAPDWVIAPVSDGPILVAVAAAYRDMLAAGRVNAVPRMACAQATGCAPIVRAFEEGAEVVAPWNDPPTTIATAIADPLRGYSDDGTLTLRTVRETGGTAIAVTDNAIRAAIRQLAATEGVFAEPAGAVPVAALAELRRRGTVGTHERVVCLITGHGLKAAEAAGLQVAMPLIDPDIDQLFGTLDSQSEAHHEVTP
jgi:threonine synthase